MTVTPLGRDQDCSLKIREPDVPAPWFLDPGGWSKTAAVSLYFIFLESVPCPFDTVTDMDNKHDYEPLVMLSMLLSINHSRILLSSTGVIYILTPHTEKQAEDFHCEL
ncbi:hypothetical protein STEG23_012119 [Scotinomys teguina]